MPFIIKVTIQNHTLRKYEITTSDQKVLTFNKTFQNKTPEVGDQIVVTHNGYISIQKGTM